MEDLLLARLNQLKEIDETLERVAKELDSVGLSPVSLEHLRLDLRGWIETAEAEYAAF